MSEFVNNTKSFFIKCRRVWHTLKKPTMTEFWMVAKISAIGISIVGAVGFAISIVVNIFSV
ncbi:MAG: protein translocase SEC61 complex subunit gamma [Nanoarchaeota archaeon]